MGKKYRNSKKHLKRVKLTLKPSKMSRHRTIRRLRPQPRRFERKWDGGVNSTNNVDISDVMNTLPRTDFDTLFTPEFIRDAGFHTATFYGKPGSGKTTMIRKLLKQIIKSGVYQRILIITQSPDDWSGFLKNTKGTLTTTNGVDVMVRSIYRKAPIGETPLEREKRRKYEEKHNILTELVDDLQAELDKSFGTGESATESQYVFLDDCADLLKLPTIRDRLSKIFKNRRHLKLSMGVSAQDFYDLHNKHRGLFTWVIWLEMDLQGSSLTRDTKYFLHPPLITKETFPLILGQLLNYCCALFYKRGQTLQTHRRRDMTGNEQRWWSSKKVFLLHLPYAEEIKKKQSKIIVDRPEKSYIF